MGTEGSAATLPRRVPKQYAMRRCSVCGDRTIWLTPSSFLLRVHGDMGARTRLVERLKACRAAYPGISMERCWTVICASATCDHWDVFVDADVKTRAPLDVPDLAWPRPAE